jgi:heat shock protein HslJ
MKTTIIAGTSALFLLISCTNQPGNVDSETVSNDSIATSAMMDNSRNSLDWEGTYSGTTPCADCEGIEVQLNINNDLTYYKISNYLGKGDSSFTESGTFEWSEDGGTITLDGRAEGAQMYRVGENVLFQLDQDGNRNEGSLAEMYKLKKHPTTSQIEGPKWMLTELMGESYIKSKDEKHPFVVFTADEKRVNGNSGCNTFLGGYELMEGNRIKMDQLASTMMACPNMETEVKFLDILKKVDNYTIADGILSLNKAKMAPLARFQAE